MKRWKRVLSIALALTLCAGLCACKGKTGDEEGKGLSGGKKGGINSELAKQYVYRLQEYDLSSVQLPGDDTYVSSVMEADGKVYMILRGYNYQKNDRNDMWRLIAADQNGDNLKVYDLQTSLKATRPVESAAQPSSESSETGENGENPEENYYSQTYEYTYFNQMQILGSDRVVGIKRYTFEDYSDPENFVSIRENSLCNWNLEGKMLSETPLDFLSNEDKWIYVAAVVGMKDGSTVLVLSGDECGRIVVDEQGNVSDFKADKGLEEFLMNNNQCIARQDGKLFMTYYQEDDWTKMYAVTYDLESGTAEEPVQLPSALTYNMGSYTLDADGDLIYSSNQGLFKYHLGDEASTQMMSYVNSDLSVYSLESIVPIDSEHFVGFYSDYDEQYYNSTIGGGLFTKVNPEDIPDKDVMVLGGNYIEQDLRKRVVEFNKTSNTHRIVLKDYSQYSNYDDWEAGYKQLNNDIIAGSMPDILVVDYNGMPLDSYISKGLLADIKVLIEKDEELSKTEFMENVFEACAVDGKLYEIIPSFYVQTYIGKTSLVGDGSNWSMEEAQKVLATMPEGAKLFSGDMTQGEFFGNVMFSCGNDFIDVSTGACNFDSDGFISLMEFAKTLPEQTPEDYYDDNWYVSYQTQYREDRTLLSSCYLNEPSDMVRVINGSFGEDISYVGFPTTSGDGSVICPSTTYVLAAKSPNLNAAWDFMRYYLTDEYQESVRWQLPISKKRFEESALKATKNPTYTDEDGKEVESNYTTWMNDEEIILEPLTMEQLNKLKEFVYSVKKRSYNNTDIYNIITEEMGAFYKGQKSAKDVAGIIQSRAKIYVNENR